MKTNEFKERLSKRTPPNNTSACEEVFVPYFSLRDHGVLFTRVHLRRFIERGLFPPAVQLSPNRVAWKLSDLTEWKATRPLAVPIDGGDA
jgi:hypothetical protein